MANTKTYFDTLASAASVADNYIIVVQKDEDGHALSTMEKATVGQLRKPIVDQIAENAHDDEVVSGSYVTGLTQTTEGLVTTKTDLFETKIDDNSSNAPSVTAVKSYVQNVRNVDIKSDINAALNTLAVEKKGGEGQYIKGISQSGGVITPEVEDLEKDLSNGSNKAPTALAAKTYVDNKVSALSYSNGNTGTLVQSISQKSGQISANIINLDSTIADASSGVPTSKAVKDKIGSLTGAVGGSSTLIKNITEKAGIISGETINLTDTVINESGYIPTSQAVYNKIGEALTTELQELTYSGGQDGSYFNRITQKGGQVEASLKAFDTEISILSNDNNVPTSLAVKKYADNCKQEVIDKIEGLDYKGIGSAGSFVQKVTQTDGLISETIVGFENGTIASYSSYSQNASVAPTVRAVTEQVKRLDTRVDDTNTTIKELNLSAVGTKGEFISSVSQAAGKLSASTTAFVTEIPDNADAANNVAPTANAVRNAINKLNVNKIGSAGNYIRFVSETNGLISATPIAFDSFRGSSASSWETMTSENAPSTEAVYKFVNKVREEILQTSEAMTYEGTVDSYASISGKKSYDKGDVYIASEKFNLESASGVQVKYNVNKGDMLIWNSTGTAYDPEGFDIIGGNEYQIVYEKTDAKIDKNYIPVFADDKGTVLISSGETVDTIVAKTSQSAAYAQESKKYAASAASSASFADAEVEPYRQNASSSASAAYDALTGAWASSEAAATAMSEARASSDAAVIALAATTKSQNSASQSATKAQGSATTASNQAASATTSANAAATAMSGALSSYNEASTAASLAQNSSTAASQSATKAQGSATTASNQAASATTAAAKASSAMSSATGYQQAAYTAASATTGFQNAASTAASLAQNSSTAASQSATKAQGSATTASNQAASATTSANVAATKAVAASQSACSAATYEANAKTACEKILEYSYDSNLDGIKAEVTKAAASSASYKDAASKSATSAADSATTAISAATKAEAFVNTSNLEKIKADAQSALSNTVSYRDAASTAASKAQDSSNAAATAATKAQGSATTASNQAASATTAAAKASSAMSSATGYQQAAYTAAVAAQGSATTASNQAASATTSANAAATAMSKAQASSDAAVTALAATTKAQSSAASAADKAYESAEFAAQYASAANLSRILTGATAAAYEASQSAQKASDTVANKLDKTTYSVQTMAGNLVVGNTASGVTLTTAGAVSATSFTATSSRKLKENISPALISALDLIETVDVVNFNYINDDEKTPHVGFIAEDTDSLLSTPHQNKMDYTNCIGVLLKAVQEITKGMSELKQEIDSLK